MYQGYQLVLTGRPRAVRERLVEVSDTSVRVTTANEKTKKHECIFLHKRVTEEIKNKLRV